MVPTNQFSSPSSSTSTTSPPSSSSFSLASTSASSTSVVASTSTMVNTNTSSSVTDVDIFDSEEFGFDRMRIGSASTKSYGLSSSYSFPSVPSVPSVTSLANYKDKDGPGKDKASFKANKGSEQKKSSSSKLNDSFSSSHSSLVSNQISMASTTSSTTLTPTPTIASTSPSSSISSPVSNSQIYSISSSPTIVNSDGHPLRQYSRSHQRRFHRRFPAVDQHEKLIDWYSCALVAEILLQGYLYISENYFAFYSNILGYKTQLLIPMCDVISVTKEKTAKIFPNAVGICTDQTKYVFGSLLSRESTFRLMQEVWKSTLIQVVSLPYFSPVMQLDKIIKGESDILIEKPENVEREEDIEEAESAASMTEESLTNNNQALIFANIKPALPEAIKLVSSEIPSIQQILSSTHQETDSSGSDSEANRDTSAVFQDSSKNLINEAKNKPQTSYGSRLIIKTKNWLITFIQPYQQIIWHQITDTTRLLLMTTTLLVMLFLSALIFLYRVEQVHSELLTLQQNTEANDFNQVQLKQIELRKEIKRLVNLLEKKTMELTVLKERIEEILNSYNHLSTCS